MIYFLYGDNTQEGNKLVNKKAAALSAELLKKKPDASLFELNEDNWNESAIDEYTGGQGLFEKKYIVLVKDILAKKDRKEIFLDKIELFAESPNIFIFTESSIDKASLKKIEKHASKTQEFTGGDEGVKGKKSGDGAFNIFALGDAFGGRNKKQLWSLYREAIDAGKVPEEIHGILFWQVKSIVLASRTKSATEAGLNPFVYSKAKSFAENFNQQELDKILEDIVRLYHDAHRGLHDFETAMEIFILSL